MRIPITRLLPLLCLLLSTQLAHELSAQCNGDPALCSKRFDEVCYVTTHNAFNYQGAFLFPNQSYDIARQLQDGVRGFMLDVYWYNNRPTVYHSSNFLGNQPLIDLLNDVKVFLDAHPSEVMSIIFESYISAAQMSDVFTQAGLLPYLHAQPIGSAWPTLADMIATNHRLVVLSDANDGQAYPWYHYVWNYAVETDYTAHGRSDFSCAYNRGDSSNSLFILNHMITQASLGYGLIDSAAAVNANPYLTSRAMGCWAATGKLPNFLTVDFYEQGDVMAAKDALNMGFVGADVAGVRNNTPVQISPNPVTEHFLLQWNAKSSGTTAFSLYDLQGRLQMQVPIPATQGPLKIDVPHSLANGTYFWQVTGLHGADHGKVIVLR